MKVRAFSFAMLLSSPLAACMTTGASQVSPGHGALAGVGEAKAGSKVDQAAPIPPPSSSAGAAGLTTPEPPPVPVAKVYTPEDLAAFVRAQRSPDAAFGPAEHELVGSLAKAPAVGSVEEAALALGLVKTVLHPLGKDQQTFVESDLDKTDKTTPRTVPVAPDSLTLEGLAKERGINLADALSENPMLQGYGVAKAFFAAVSQPGNTPGFKAEITSALKNQASKWQGLAQDMNAADGAAPPPQADPNALSAPAVPPPAVAADNVAPDPAELHASDSALGEAQALADRGDFKAAIKKAEAIDKTSPLYNSAQEKVKEFSNRAVQDLRKKAAQAFQSAMPLNDKKTRAQYLQQAKSYLEDALNSYPQASQLPTVRDNLRVISKDLEQSQSH